MSYTIGGTAREASDYQNIGRSIIIAAGASSATLTITPIDDTEVDVADPDTVRLTLASGSGYSVGSPRRATVTIADNDVAVTVRATDPNASETGPDPGVFTFTRTGSTASALTVNYTIGGTAREASDYQNIGRSIIIAAGASSATLTITPIDDTVVDVAETVVLTLASGSGYSVGSPRSATVIIADNDVAVTVRATDANASETGPDPGVFTFTRTGSTASALTVNYTIGGGTAREGSDFESIGTSIFIAAGATSATLTITPIDDTEVERADTVVLTLASGSGYSVGSPTRATVTIADNDVAAPANDNFNFANPTTIRTRGAEGTVRVSNVGATKENGEPNHAGNTGGRSVWWTWTPAASGTAVISTAGSSFDTTLGVYTGSSVSALSMVASDNDSGGNRTSRVTFNAVAGVPYQIAVDGFDGASGSITLGVTVTFSGKLTFKAEGVTDMQTLWIHWAGTAGSGVTIGRGYDLGTKTWEEAIRDLTRAGVPQSQAEAIGGAVGLKGDAARNFVTNNRNRIGQITLQQQWALFARVYPVFVARAEYRYWYHQNHDNGQVRNEPLGLPWDSLHWAIRDVLVDFVYQGYGSPEPGHHRPMRAGMNNNFDELINYIRSSEEMMGWEAGRQRVRFLETHRPR